MGSINMFVGSGRLTRDPDLRYSRSSMAVCRFTMALNDVDYDGETKQPRATFLNVVCFHKQAESVMAHLKKGSFTEVVGRIQMVDVSRNGDTYQAPEIEARLVNFVPLQKE